MNPIKIEEDYLIFDGYLVISDLHIGLEKYFEECGYKSPQQDVALANKIRRIVRKKDVNKLIILGDLKETITHATEYERIKIRMFMKKIKEYFEEIVLVKGNHDANIEKIGINAVPYFVHKNVIFYHGHKKIPEEVLKENKISKIIIGHAHPLYTIKDKRKLSYHVPCWLVGKYNGIETIVLPSFSDLVTGKHYKGKWPGPIVSELKDMEIFLKDMSKVK